MAIVHVDKIEGIVAPNKFLRSALKTSVELANSLAGILPDNEHLPLRRITLLSAIHTVNALLAASSAKCTLSSPPADIDMVPDSTGDLILRCQHPHPHMWKLGGEKI